MRKRVIQDNPRTRNVGISEGPPPVPYTSTAQVKLQKLRRKEKHKNKFYYPAFHMVPFGKIEQGKFPRQDAAVLRLKSFFIAELSVKIQIA